MIELTGFCANRTRLSGLGWGALMGQEVEIIPWIAGLIIERYFGIIIFSVTLGFLIHILCPSTIPILNTISQAFFQIFSYLRLKNQSFVIPDWIGTFLLWIPFLIEPSGVIRFFRAGSSSEEKDHSIV
jgi:hypothetical protein